MILSAEIVGISRVWKTLTVAVTSLIASLLIVLTVCYYVTALIISANMESNLAFVFGPIRQFVSMLVFGFPSFLFAAWDRKRKRVTH